MCVSLSKTVQTLKMRVSLSKAVQTLKMRVSLSKAVQTLKMRVSLSFSTGVAVTDMPAIASMRPMTPRASFDWCADVSTTPWGMTAKFASLFSTNDLGLPPRPRMPTSAWVSSQYSSFLKT
ncbi:hypothetical protein AVEN_179723-1 [Araneus ventricosus]|uniref:Uncharacterized protein n=1 Tax=Araneus ventricosus TaxID=182803 RepID=A0A4Y2X2H7_ARAVE|nr:hypothetical protein AVEN_179723-1 [Araneus ventricosus]